MEFELSIISDWVTVLDKHQRMVWFPLISHVPIIWYCVWNEGSSLLHLHAALFFCTNNIRLWCTISFLSEPVLDVTFFFFPSFSLFISFFFCPSIHPSSLSRKRAFSPRYPLVTVDYRGINCGSSKACRRWRGVHYSALWRHRHVPANRITQTCSIRPSTASPPHREKKDGNTKLPYWPSQDAPTNTLTTKRRKVSMPTWSWRMQWDSCRMVNGK